MLKSGTANVVHPEGAVRQEDVINNYQNVQQLVYQETMPALHLVSRLPLYHHRHQRLRRSNSNRRPQRHPRKHSSQPTPIRQTPTPFPPRKDRREMVLPASRGIYTREFRQGQTRAGHGCSDSDNAVEQRDGAAGLDGDGEAGGDGDPAVGDVVTDGDDVEDAEFTLHGGGGGEAGDDLAGCEFDFGDIAGLLFDFHSSQYGV